MTKSKCRSSLLVKNICVPDRVMIERREKEYHISNICFGSGRESGRLLPPRRDATLEGEMFVYFSMQLIKVNFRGKCTVNVNCSRKHFYVRFKDPTRCPNYVFACSITAILNQQRSEPSTRPKRPKRLISHNYFL